MKKEKLKKVDTNENSVKVDDTKLRNKFKLLKRLMIFLEGLLLVPVLITILTMGIIAGEIIISGTNEVAKGIVVDEKVEGESEIEPDDIVKFAEEVTGEELALDGTADNYKYMIAVSSIVVACMDYMCVVFIVGCLSKIFKTIEEEGTPFTLNNIKYLNKIDKYAVILFLFGTANISISLISLIIISAISYIFKYGYRIQQEVDETL